MAGLSAQQKRALKKFFADSGYTHTEEWIQQCIDWIYEENNGAPYSFDLYKRELLDQWQDANLNVLESACLPSDLKDQKVVTLKGKYGLQVINVRDIGDSSYNQMKKIKKLENDNVNVVATDSNEIPSWEPKASRCLYLTLTDGSQQIFGLEKQYCPTLKLDMKPGCKIIIMGPVVCRRGVLHLKPNNVNFIGGEVEQMFQDNNVEAILTKQLELASVSNGMEAQTHTWNNPSPADSTASSITRQRPNPVQVKVKTETQNSNASSSSSHIRTNSRGDEIVGDFPDSQDEFPDMGDFGAEDDEIFMQIDEEALIRSTETASTASSSRSTFSSSATSSSNNVFDKTTQEVKQSSSTSKRTNFTEDIEDFEDDPNFIPRPSSVSAPVSSKPNASTTSINVPKSVFNKPKSVFVPPIKTTPAPEGNDLSSKLSRNKPLSSFSAATNDQRGKSGTSGSFTNSFQSAKTVLKNTKSSDNGNGSNTSGKQLNITQYMKPMPIIIDPPTPERQAIKRRKGRKPQSQILTSP